MLKKFYSNKLCNWKFTLSEGEMLCGIEDRIWPKHFGKSSFNAVEV